MYNYEMDPTKTVGTTERTQDAGQMDGLTDGRTETNIPCPPTTLLCEGYNQEIRLYHHWNRYLRDMTIKSIKNNDAANWSSDFLH